MKHPRSAVCWLLCLCTTSILATPSPVAAQRPDEGQQLVESVAQHRTAAALPVTLVTPHFSLSNDRESSLILLNNFSEPMSASITATDSRGEPVANLRRTIGQHSFLDLSLTELLGPSAHSSTDGSLLVSFLGDPQMMSAWIVHQQRGRVVEWPLVQPAAAEASSLVAFWDAGVRSGAQATFYLLNTTSAPVTYQMRLGDGRGVLDLVEGTVDPGARQRLVAVPRTAPPLARGWIELDHDGEPGALIGLGLLETLPRVSNDPGHQLVSVSPLLARPVETPSERESLAIPISEPGGRTHITLFNPTDRTQEARIEVLDFATGQPLAWAERELGQRGLATVLLDSLLGQLAPSALPDEVRVRVVGTHGPVQVSGLTRLPDGSLADVPFFDLATAHWTGSYPVAGLGDHEVVNTMVNVGDRTARIGAQLFWEGGTYVLPTIHIEPGHSHRIDLSRLAAEKIPGRLGNRIDPQLRQGFLQWVSRGGGSHRILARTEATGAGSHDAVGFNCTLCCWHQSFGRLDPFSVSFVSGSSLGFEAAEFINTCTGTLGPYYAYPTGLSFSAPLSWNGQTVSASSATSQTVSFNFVGEHEPFSIPPCPTPYTANMTGFGDAEVTDKFVVYYKSQGSISPTECQYVKCKTERTSGSGSNSLPQNCTIGQSPRYPKTAGGSCHPGLYRSVTVRKDESGNTSCTPGPKTPVNLATINNKCP